jgi:hypothetical protein
MANASPQELFSVGGEGTACASIIHATVDPPFPGKEAVGGETVYVYTHWMAVPVQSVYVQVYVFVPEQTGSALTAGPVGVIIAPQEFETPGGVGTV